MMDSNGTQNTNRHQIRTGPHVKMKKRKINYKSNEQMKKKQLIEYIVDHVHNIYIYIYMYIYIENNIHN